MLSLLIIFFFRHQTFRHRFLQVSIRWAKKRRSWKTREKSGTCREVLFPVDGACIGPDARTRNGRLKEVLLRDKPEVIRLSRGKLSFLPAGFFVGLQPPTNIHSRLTLLFTVCGCLSNFLPLIGIFSSRAFCYCFIFSLSFRSARDNSQWISIASGELELFRISIIEIIKDPAHTMLRSMYLD